MEKNETYTVTAEGYTAEGAAITRINGVVIFVPGLLIGEEAEIGITAMKKNYGYGRVIKVLGTFDYPIDRADKDLTYS